MNIYQVKEDGHVVFASTKESSVRSRAKRLLAQADDANLLCSISVYRKGTLIAVETNRRIDAHIVQYAEIDSVTLPFNVEKVDITEVCLALPLSTLLSLRDQSLEAKQLVINSGFTDLSIPSLVQVCESIKLFFGVSFLAEISTEALAYALQNYNAVMPPAYILPFKPNWPNGLDVDIKSLVSNH